MIQLTPLDKNVAGQELIQIGRIEGRMEGIGKGKLISKIDATQRFLKRRVTPEKKLLEQNPKTMQSDSEKT